MIILLGFTVLIVLCDSLRTHVFRNSIPVTVKSYSQWLVYY